MVQNQPDHWDLVLDPKVSKIKVLDFFLFFLLTEFGHIKQKVENGSCSRLSCVNQHNFKCMYDKPYESTHGTVLNVGTKIQPT